MKDKPPSNDEVYEAWKDFIEKRNTYRNNKH